MHQNSLSTGKLSGLFVLLCATVFIIGCSTKINTTKANTIAIISDSDSNLVQRVYSFVSLEMNTTPSLVALSKLEMDRYNTAPADFINTTSSAYLFSVLLLDNPIQMPDPAKTKGITNTAILDLNALKPEPYDAEVFSRRVEKETMRQIGRMLGAEDCLIPGCAMYKTENQTDLDAKGRNFCPPCSVKLGEILRGKGLLKAE